jgi:hypothetical protein
MKATELFRVFHNGVGLWSVVVGIGLLPRGMQLMHQYADADTFFFMLMGTFASPAILIACGYWLMFTRDSLVQLACSRSSDVTGNSSYRVTLAVVLKTIGLWEAIVGASTVPVAIDMAHRYSDRLSFISLWVETYIAPACLIAAGYVLLFKTHWIVRLAFLSKPEGTLAEAGDSTSPPQLFLVIQKAAGAWTIINAISLIPMAIRKSQLYAAGFPLHRMLLETFLDPALLLLMGCWLFFATNWFVRLAYSETAAADDEETMAESPSA